VLNRDDWQKQYADEVYFKNLCKNSLHTFAKRAWKEIEAVDFQDNWHIQAVCEHLEALHYGQIKRLIINICPRSMKTTIFNVIFPAWVWLHNPGEQFLCVSVSEDLAFKGATDSRHIIQSDWYQKSWGHLYKLSKEQNTKERYTNSANGYRLSTTYEAKNMGKGGSYIMIDDPNNPYDSALKHQNLLNIWKGTLSNRLNNPSDKIILGQQRTGIGDLTSYLVATSPEDWTQVCIPMEFDSARKCRTIILPSTNGKIWEDPREKDGQLMWPERVDEKRIISRKKEIGTRIFNTQYNQFPTDEEGGIFLRKWWQVWKELKTPKLTHIIQSWDTALTEKKQSAYSACTTWGIFLYKHIPNFILLSAWQGRVNGSQLLKRAIRLKNNYRDTGENIKEPDSRYSPDIVIIEAKASGYRLVSDLIERGIPAHAFNPDKDGDKVSRANLSSPYVECGFGWVPGRQPDFITLRSEAELFVEAATMFPGGESLDLIDTFTQFILYAKARGLLTHPDEMSLFEDELTDEQLPGFKKEHEKEFARLSVEKEQSEERGCQNKDQNYDES